MRENTFDPYNWKESFFHMGISWNSRSTLGSGVVPREEKRMTKLDKQSNTNESFGNDPEEEKPHGDYTVPQKVQNQTYWKHDQNAII